MKSANTASTPDRKKLLVHIRRIATLLQDAMRNGPDGTLEGEFGDEHPTFVHQACGFYLAGSLAYLEGEDGAHSWNKSGAQFTDFDAFLNAYPPPPKDSYAKRGFTKSRMNALAELRNAIVHNDGDLSKNKNSGSLTMVTSANFPGVSLNGSVVTLNAAFLEFVRVATYSVRNYHGEF
jgi:hypothetical protein